MDKVEKLLWKYMIDHGSIRDWSFYGSCFGSYGDDVEGDTKKVKREIAKHGIDWKKTKPVQEDMESSFTDTFHDPDYVSVLRGTLWLKNGKKFTFGSTDTVPEILKAMSSYINDPFEQEKLDD